MAITQRGDLLVATNGIPVTREQARRLAELDPAGWNSLTGRLARMGYTAVEYRRRVSAYAEVRRELNQPAKPAVAPKAGKEGRVLYFQRIHEKALGRGYAAPAGKWDGLHCFGCQQVAKLTAKVS